MNKVTVLILGLLLGQSAFAGLNFKTARIPAYGGLEILLGRGCDKYDYQSVVGACPEQTDEPQVIKIIAKKVRSGTCKADFPSFVSVARQDLCVATEVIDSEPRLRGLFKFQVFNGEELIHESSQIVLEEPSSVLK